MTGEDRRKEGNKWRKMNFMSNKKIKMRLTPSFHSFSLSPLPLHSHPHMPFLLTKYGLID